MTTDRARTESVAAVVVTHNDSVALAGCLRALAEQTRPPDEVIVVDNASSPRVVGVECGGVPVRVLRSEVNGGPAGGFADGLESFLRGRAAWAWVMDDDCEPEPEALAVLLDDAAYGSPRSSSRSCCPMVGRSTGRRGAGCSSPGRHSTIRQRDSLTLHQRQDREQ